MHSVMEAKVSLSLLILILLPILSIAGRATYSSSSSSLDVSPFGLFKYPEKSKKEDKVEGIHKVKQHLERYGYLNTISRHADDDNDDDFDDALEPAMKSLKIYSHLSPTGILDTPIVKKMSKSKCGVPNIVEGKRGGRGGFGSSHYSFFQGKPVWPADMRHLKYFYDTSVYPEAALSPIVNAFSSWANVSPFTFERTSDREAANIKVSFQIGDHGDGFPFGNGPNAKLAHAFAPTDGRLHFNAEKKWAIGAVANAYDLESIATHEIGHLLGLQHSVIQEAIMFPDMNTATVKRIAQDDIDGINALYSSILIKA